MAAIGIPLPRPPRVPSNVTAYETSQIYANRDSCKNTALLIASELQLLPPLKMVQVSEHENGLGNGGCVWIVIFLSVTGMLKPLKGRNVAFSRIKKQKKVVFLMLSSHLKLLLFRK